MGMIRRMNILRELFNCRVGPGAVIIPKDVSRIHLTFSRQLADGHEGSRTFWQEYLPRLKYHNPALNVTVDPKLERGSSALMNIYFSGKQARVSTTQSKEKVEVAESEASERMETINLEQKKVGAILQEVLKATGATEVEFSAEDLAQLEEFKRMNAEKAIDSVKKKAVAAKLNEEKKAEEALRKSAVAA